MPYIKGEKFREMIRSINIFLSIFDLTILYDENDDYFICSWMNIIDSKGNIVGTLRGPSWDRELRKPAYYIDASTEAFPNIKARIISSPKTVINEPNMNMGIHSFYAIDYNVRTNNRIANNLSGSFVISDPINDPDSREKSVEREVDFDLKVSQRPNEIFSISSKNVKFVVREEYCEKYGYTGTRIIKMEYEGGFIKLTIRKDGNSSLIYSGINGEYRATATVMDNYSHVEVFCTEKNDLAGLTDEEIKKYRSKKLERILTGTSFEKTYDDLKRTVIDIPIEYDKRGNVLQLFNAISTYIPQVDMYEIPNLAPTLMDYFGSERCLPIHVFYSLMSVSFGFLNDDELSSLIGLNPRKLAQTPITDRESGCVTLPQHKEFAIKKG